MVSTVYTLVVSFISERDTVARKIREHGVFYSEDIGESAFCPSYRAATALRAVDETASVNCKGVGGKHTCFRCNGVANCRVPLLQCEIECYIMNLEFRPIADSDEIAGFAAFPT